MKKLDLNKAAEEFETIDAETYMYYNTETGEFDFYTEFMLADLPGEIDTEKFEDDEWIAAPSQRDLNEYRIMEDFVGSVTDTRANELLFVALEGRGAFRRFKDTLRRVSLEEEWYAFKRKAYIEIAREWCEENEIEYIDNTENRESKPQSSERTDSTDILIIPLASKIADDVAEVLIDALNYSKTNAEQEVKRMLSSKRISLAAIVKNTDGNLRVVGIAGAIPQYGVTGWELHPLAVLKAYQRHGIGRLLMEALESEAADRGGVMLYLGSDDESGTTSLFGADLYEDTFGKLANIQNIGGHPYPFYEKLGYKIVGVFPDANGIGKPDIWMAKRIKQGREF